MVLLRILAGIALLVAGRRLFWLFVGLIGFLSGVRLASHFFPGQPEWMVFAIALMAGVFGAFLALVLQWFAIGLAGFFAGGYILATMVKISGWETDGTHWLFLIGGILGALLILVLFRWALIILSSLAGAGLIIETLHADRWVAILLFAALFIAGVFVQSRVRGTQQP